MICEESRKLYRMMKAKGFPEDFCREAAGMLNTEWTARRMIGYLAHVKKPSLEDAADEILAILEDRNRIMRKKVAESTNAAINRMIFTDFDSNNS